MQNPEKPRQVREPTTVRIQGQLPMRSRPRIHNSLSVTCTWQYELPGRIRRACISMVGSNKYAVAMRGGPFTRFSLITVLLLLAANSLTAQKPVTQQGPP